MRRCYSPPLGHRPRRPLAVVCAARRYPLGDCGGIFYPTARQIPRRPSTVLPAVRLRSHCHKLRGSFDSQNLAHPFVGCAAGCAGRSPLRVHPLISAGPTAAPPRRSQARFPLPLVLAVRHPLTSATLCSLPLLCPASLLHLLPAAPSVGHQIAGGRSRSHHILWGWSCSFY